MFLCKFYNRICCEMYIKKQLFNNLLFIKQFIYAFISMNESKSLYMPVCQNVDVWANDISVFQTTYEVWHGCQLWPEIQILIF